VEGYNWVKGMGWSLGEPGPRLLRLARAVVAVEQLKRQSRRLRPASFADEVVQQQCLFRDTIIRVTE
jgi:hypothetical protein